MGTPITRSHSTSDERALHAALRREMLLLRRREGRRRFDTVVHVGELGSEERSCALPDDAREVLDPGTRTDIVTALLEELVAAREGTNRARGWLTRYGEPELQDEDLTWLAAAIRAFGVLQLDLEGFWTITRTGWIDVRTGERRVWKRPRPPRDRS